MKKDSVLFLAGWIRKAMSFKQDELILVLNMQFLQSKGISTGCRKAFDEEYQKETRIIDIPC